MHLLDKTVHHAITTGVLLAGLAMSLICWFLAYTQARVEAFNEYAPAGTVLLEV